MKISGKVSHFGGPEDTGVSPDEGLAFIFEVSDKPELFLPTQPPGTSGLARRLNPEVYYIACRWDYDQPDQSKEELLYHLAVVRSPKTGREFLAYPADWGPNSNTGRVADISPGLMEALGITTDDEVEVTYPAQDEDEEEIPVVTPCIAISAGHGRNIAGASGILEESEETPRVMYRVAAQLVSRGLKAVTFWDQASTNVSDNLDAICDWHNDQIRDLDVSIHFNCSNGQGHGTEVLYVTQEDLASRVATAIAANGFANRGAKYRSDLAFLNRTDMPAILVEVCFIDNEGDVSVYNAKFDQICASIASAIALWIGAPPVELPVEPPGRPELPPRPPQGPGEPGEPGDARVVMSLAVPPGIELVLTINGEQVLLD